MAIAGGKRQQAGDGLFDLNLEIAGLGIRIEMEDAALHGAALSRYGTFAPTGPASLRLLVQGVEPPERPREGEMVVRPLGHGRYRIRRPDLECLVDLRNGQASARLAPSPFALDALLRVILTLLLAREGGFLLHSAGLLRRDRAYIFYGVSGAGKSTTVRHPGDAAILSDELVAVRRAGEGFRAYGTPFSGEMGCPGEAVSGPLAALLKLGRPPGPVLERLGPSEAGRGLLRCALYFGGNRQDTDALLRTCLELAGAVPCYHLRLRLEAPLWEQLDELERLPGQE